MNIANTSTPVTVLASPHHGALAVTRSLGRLGIPVYNVGASGWSPAFLSRYSRRRLRWNVDQAPPEESHARLIEWGRQCGSRSILIPTTDAGSRLVADFGDSLREFFIFPGQSAPLVRSLCSKKEMHALAQKFRVPAPVTLFPQTRRDLLACGRDLPLPLMIKAIHGQKWIRGSKTKFVVRSVSRFFDLCRQIGDASVPDLMVQEYIPGDEDSVWMFNGYFDERADCVVGFSGRKLRQCPAYTGVASLAVCEPNAQIEQQAGAFMKALGYSGIVDIDFRFDERDGQYKVLDVNPRIGSTFRLFVSSDGMDVARACYLDLTGQPVAAGRTPRGRKWIVEDLDFVTSLRYRSDGKLGFGEWIRSLGGISEFSFLCWDDPLPLAAMLHADMIELARRLRPRTAGATPFVPKSTAEAAERHVYLG